MNFQPSNFHSNGKLLITGEYFVLDGALALALPTKLGQSLQVVENEAATINWTSYDADNSVWFSGIFSQPFGKFQNGTDEAVGERLTQIFQAIQQQKPNFFQQFKGLQIETRLDFPREWGLGTSSTLIANLANWAKIDPFELLKNTFGGSGYDIACANASGPILYQLIDKRPLSAEALLFLTAEAQSTQSRYEPYDKNHNLISLTYLIENISFAKPFTNQLYFIYLGKKQDSRQGIAHYRQKVNNQPDLIAKISNLTQQFIDCQSLLEFENLIVQHETIVSETLELPRAKDLYFSNYWGEIKSLGAWGGDFVLATSDRTAAETHHYFNEKGFSVVLNYNELIL